MKIATKFPLAIVVLALVAAAITGAVAYLNSSHEIREANGQNLLALMESRASALLGYGDSIRQDLRIQARSPQIKTAIIEFTDAWGQLGSGQTETLQRIYVSENPYAKDKRGLLSSAKDGSQYNTVHARHHPWLRRIKTERGYYDVFLFDPNGNLLYTVAKEFDFATNLISGPYQDSGLARVFRAARGNPTPDYQAFVDFERYEASGGVPASFVSAAVLDDGGELIGVIAIQMPGQRINEILQITVGMGETGETYLVGEDLLMRTNSRFTESSTVLTQRVDTVSVKRAFAGETGVGLIHDYRGIPVISAYRQIEFMGARFVLLSEIDQSEAFAPLRQVRNRMLLGALAAAFLAATIGIFLVRSVTSPLARIGVAMSKVAGDQLDTEVPALNRDDEIGDMAKALTVFRENALQALRDSKSRLRAIHENISNGIITIDEKGAIESFNAGAEKIFGYDRDGVIGQNVSMLMSDPNREQHDTYLANYARTGIANLMEDPGREVEAKRKDGSTFPAEVTISEFWLDGERRFIGSLIDISKRKEAEARVAELQRVEAVGQLTGGFAHEFNNILAAALLNLEVLKIKCPDSDNTQQKEFLGLIDRVIKTTRRGASLTDQLLAYSKKKMLIPRPVRISSVLEDLQEQIRELLGEETGIGVRILYNDDRHTFVDPNQLRNALLCLVSNARDAMPEGGLITIEASNVDLRPADLNESEEAEPGPYVMVSVNDTGAGVPEDVQSHVFEPFFTTKEIGKGTGLGLSMVQGFASQSGGLVSLDSAPGQGATVRLYLPTAN